MAVIKIDLDDMKKTLSAVQAYRDIHQSNIKNMAKQVDSCGSAWMGEDSKEFAYKWAQMNTSNGVLSIVQNNIENYEEVLSTAIECYREAQRKTVEEAEKIEWF